MKSKMLINASDGEECRIAKVSNNKLVEFYFEAGAKEITKGNIYKGIVVSVEQSLQAAFVDYGEARHGFLQMQELHKHFFSNDQKGKKTNISSCLKKGQEIIVQVIKDPVMKKGAMLSTFVALAGRHLVFLPYSNVKKGISKKITDEEEREKLKKKLETIKITQDAGVIVRTASEKATKSLLLKDYRSLKKVWNNIFKKSEEEKAPALLLKEKDLTIRTIRDYLTDDVFEILVDHHETYKQLKHFLNIISVPYAKRVKHYKDEEPIFSKYQIENQIASILEKRVYLKSGGSIVIEQTEAMVTVDVNSGKFKKQNSLEETAVKINMEAAEEIARQLRLRDLGGLIVIDFIDMQETKNKSQLESFLKSQFKEDKARVNIGRISRFGLVEMSRQRMGQSVESKNFVRCRHCNGKGNHMSIDLLGINFLRLLKLKTLKAQDTSFDILLPYELFIYVLNNKRKDISQLEEKKKINININPSPTMILGECSIKEAPKN